MIIALQVQSALISLDFMNPHKDLQSVNGHHLRKYVELSMLLMMLMMFVVVVVVVVVVIVKSNNKIIW